MKPFQLKQKLSEYLLLRDGLGYTTSRSRTILEQFVTHLQENTDGQQVPAQLVIDWACNSSPRSGIPAKYGRLVLARGFLFFLRSSFPAIEIPDTRMIAARQRSIPHVFSTDELSNLLTTTSKMPNSKNICIHSKTAKTMFALLSCTGIRPGEAIALTVGDVILDDQPRLLIRRTKFDKSRWVPIHPSAVEHLQEFARWRRKFGGTSSSPFFVAKSGESIRYQALRRLFLRVLELTKIQTKPGQLRPSLHSFRHTFAVNRVTSWYEGGLDAKSLMPTLSVYLGHVSLSGTYWYLSTTPELMEAASRRFETYAEGL